LVSWVGETFNGSIDQTKRETGLESPASRPHSLKMVSSWQ
jgi:hypothetical protein